MLNTGRQDIEASLRDATAALEKLRATEDSLVKSLRGMQLAQAYALGIPRHPDASSELESDAAPYLNKAKAWPHRLEDDIRQTEFTLAEMKPFLRSAWEEYEAAATRVTDHVARTLVPRHRQAVKNIARALETLSAAMAAER